MLYAHRNVIEDDSDELLARQQEKAEFWLKVHKARISGKLPIATKEENDAHNAMIQKLVESGASAK